MQIVEQLRAMGSHVEEALPYVNHGGCCVYAAAVAARLQRLGVPVWGIVGNAWMPRDTNLNTIRENNRPRNKADWSKAGVQFSHVLIQFIDGGQIWTHDTGTTTAQKLTRDPSCGSPLMDGYLTVAEMVKLAAETSWNRCFDRGAGIPVIRAGVRKFLSRTALKPC